MLGPLNPGSGQPFPLPLQVDQHSPTPPARTFSEALSQSPIAFAHRFIPLHRPKPLSFKGQPPPGCPLSQLISISSQPPSLSSDSVPAPALYSPSPAARRHRSPEQPDLLSSHPPTALSPADQACRPGAHLPATSLSLRHLKPTTAHSDFRLFTTAAPHHHHLLAHQGHQPLPPRPSPLWSTFTALFYLGTPGSFPLTCCVASGQVPSLPQHLDTWIL